MKISLKLLTFITLTTIVVIVAATCLGVTLGIILHTINQVGEAWVKGISGSITNSITTYLRDIQSQLASASTLVQELDMITPFNESSLRGRNWTQVFVPWLLQFSSMHAGETPQVTVSFTDYFWSYASRSVFAFDDSVRIIEWMENLQNATPPTASQITVGGIQYDEITMQRTAASGFNPETPRLNVSLILPVVPAVKNSLLALYKYRPAGQTTACFSALLHTYVTSANGGLPHLWGVHVVCAIMSRNDTFLGYDDFAIDLDRVMPKMLRKLKKSPHGEAFIVAPGPAAGGATEAYVISTSRPEQFWTGGFQSATTPVPVGCYSTADVKLNGLPNPHVACPLSTRKYPYAPLNAVSVSFATTPTFEFGLFDLADGTTAAIASRRIVTSVAGLLWNIVVVLPEEDLYLGQIKNSIGLSAGMAVLVSAIGIGAALVLLHLLTRRLEEVQKKMLSLAQLNTLDKEEDITIENREQRETDDEAGKKNFDETKDAVDVFFGRKRRNSDEKLVEASNEEEQEEEKGSSWIAEVANLENAYAETVKSLTNFTRYVSRAVVSELIIQRKMTLQKQEQQNHQEQLAIEPLPGMVAPHSSSSSDVHAHGISHDAARLREAEIDANVASEYEVTVLIAEIEGFSSQIWATNPENHDGVLYILHIYFKRMCRLIMGHGGVVDKFMGDSIMSYWGAPVKTEHHALLATLAALAMLRESKRDPLKKIFTQTLKREVKLRCGLSSGPAVVGTFGNAECVNYSIVGTPVTQSRHLQQFAQTWGTAVLMDGNCMRKCDDRIVHRLVCQAQFEINAKPVMAYEVLGLNLDCTRVRQLLISASRHTSTLSSTSESRTIAFTDVLSLPTINSANQGVEGILMRSTNIVDVDGARRSGAARFDNNNSNEAITTSLDLLLRWHAKNRTGLGSSNNDNSSNGAAASRNNTNHHSSTNCIEFAEQCSEAVRFMINCEFAKAEEKFDQLVADFPILEGKENVMNPRIVENKSIHNNENNSGSIVGGDGSVTSISSVESLPAIWDVSMATKSIVVLRDLVSLYSKGTKPSRNSIDVATGTYFIRAFKLKEIHQLALEASAISSASSSRSQSSGSSESKKSKKSKRNKKPK